MHLRRQRIHQSGSCNKDYRLIDQERPASLAKVDFLATHKNNKFDEVIQSRLARTAPNPLSTTKSAYDELDKQINIAYQFDSRHVKENKALVERPRYAHLEEKEKRKRAWVGDSLIYLDDLHEKQGIKKPEDEFLKKKNKNYKKKHIDHATAIAETQFVGFSGEFNQNTLDGKVDIEKVKEIRRLIRRRYANRRNFQKIFNQWDSDHTGTISAQNILNMITKMGVNVNIDESRVLMYSADQNNSGNLTLDEFMELIFTDCENFNVDLTKIPVNGAAQGGPGDEQENLHSTQEAEQYSEQLVKQLEKEQQNRHNNQVNVVLKNKLKDLQSKFKIADELNQGFLSFQQFEKIMKRLPISDSILNSKDIKNLYDANKHDENKFDYKQFLNQLEIYEFRPEDIYKDPKELKQQLTDKQKGILKYKADLQDNQITIYDAPTVNPTHLEKIRFQAKKVFRVLERYLKNKDDFNQFFQQQFKVDDDKFSKLSVSKSQLTNFIQNLFMNMGEKDVNKYEIESFLSVFTYNNHNQTNARDVSKTIYDETDSQWYDHIQQRVNRPVPPPESKFHPDFPQEFNQQIQSPTQSQQSKKQNWFTFQHPSKNEVIQPLLDKFDQRVFCGTQKALDIFRNFDIDNDGYVSQNDMVTKLKDLDIFKQDEIKPFLEYVDPNNKGYVDFQEFSSKLRCGMTNNDENGKQIYLPYQLPDRAITDNLSKNLPYIKQTYREFPTPFKPELTGFQKATRFGSTPPFQNTFTNFRMDKNCPMYASSEQRFNKDHNHRTQFQKEEQFKRESVDRNRLSTLKNHLNVIQERVESSITTHETKDAEKRKTKGLAQWTYEHRCHLQNDWK